jgi:hypothetical protein
MKNKSTASTPTKRIPTPRITSKVIRDPSRDSSLAQEILHRFGPLNPTRPGTKI